MFGPQPTRGRKDLDEKLHGCTAVGKFILYAHGNLLQNTRDQDKPLRIVFCQIVFERSDAGVDDAAASGEHPQFERTFGDVPYG
mmetsp:Transcript_3190/g.1942  ORF Transcript_3190/g.1942 Transcript_3190/m.1942 type:complete len:84 (+) Transcript_3190:2-253(+)